jgi:hypothetical protein
MPIENRSRRPACERVLNQPPAQSHHRISEARTPSSLRDHFRSNEQNAFVAFDCVTLSYNSEWHCYIADTALTQILGYADFQKI